MSNLETYITSLKGKKILIQGLGLNGGGVGTALFFLENGLPVTITDLKTQEQLHDSVEQLSPYKSMCNFVLGQHREQDFIDADIVVKGPGVNPANNFIQLAIKNGAKITSDIEIFYEICPCKLYAVTGSKGKSSTVSCIFEIFKAFSDNVFLGGNITISPLSFYKKLNNESLVILELSSWQLRDLRNSNVKFAGACLTNLMHDHQNYYHNMQDYLNDKLVITQNQTNDDFILLPLHDEFIKNVSSNAKHYYFSNVFEKNADFYYDTDTQAFYFKEKYLFATNDIKAFGVHTMINVLIAAAFATLVGIDQQTIVNGIRNFKGAPFRLEHVATINGVTFINDTTATIPEAAVSAIRSFKNVIWIGGGNDKNLDFSSISTIYDIPKYIFLLSGDGTNKIIANLNSREYVLDSSLEVLVNKAFEVARPGDIVLLSPGATSFGLFANEFERGRLFNKYVNQIKEKVGNDADK